jgi:hypothetical protein
MKRLLLIFTAILILTTIIAAGCGQKAVVKGPEAVVVSSCVTCHTDKDMLKETAEPEPEEEKSEETKGEG